MRRKYEGPLLETLAAIAERVNGGKDACRAIGPNGRLSRCTGTYFRAVYFLLSKQCSTCSA